MTMVAVGIDVAKGWLDVACLNTATKELKKARFSNTKTGINTLIDWLPNYVETNQIHVCLEATGTYSNTVAKMLIAQHYPVSVLNPIQAKGYAKIHIVRHSTDEIDAALLANYCAAINPPLWVPPAPEISELQQLFRHRKSLVKDKTRARVRLQTPDLSKSVQHLITQEIKAFEKQIKQADTVMARLIKKHTILQDRMKLLTSIPGIGQITAIGLIAEIGDVHRFSTCQKLISYAGLSPVSKTSGKSVNKKSKMSSLGKRSLRSLMYMPALTAIRCNPIIKAHYERMLNAGKHTMICIGAAMRKLLRLVYGVLKSGQLFNPNHGHTQPILA